jgi:hypothetical protein
MAIAHWPRGPTISDPKSHGDSKKYACMGGWGFSHFNERYGKPAERALLQTCFPCHQAIKARDLVITRYAP